VHATRYGAATSGGGIAWRVSPPEDVRGRTVLLLDDILDHGKTLRAIRDQLLAQGAERVLSAVLVEKELSVPKPVRADFVGVRIPDRFVFGCGMDAKGFWRNLPEIRAMRAT
jgi:hypoxanthine phosphoribosyltransferase